MAIQIMKKGYYCCDRCGKKTEVEVNEDWRSGPDTITVPAGWGSIEINNSDVDLNFKKDICNSCISKIIESFGHEGNLPE